MARGIPYAHQTMFVGMACSLLLHAAGVGVFAWVGTREAQAVSAEAESQLVWPEDQPAPPPEVKPPPEEPAEPEQPADMKFGIDRADDVKANAWKGFETATEHLAPESTVDQPALSTVPGNPGPVSPPSPATAPPVEPLPMDQPAAEPAAPAPETAEPKPETNQAPEPSDADQSAPAPSESPAEQQPDAQQPLEQQPEPVQPLPLQPEVQQPDMVGPPAPAELLLPPMQRDAAQPLEAQPNPQQPLPRQPLEPSDGQSGTPGDTPPATAARPPAPTSPAANAIPGEKSDSESWASAVEGSLVYRPGHPLGAKGLQVTTVAPRWSVTTQIVAKPRNAVILIKFGRSGKVLQAEFAEGQSTGYSEVDGPLLDAVYRWTAKGKLLEKIPSNDPDAGLVFSVRFLFN